jgi:hypothetical protein
VVLWRERIAAGGAVGAETISLSRSISGSISFSNTTAAVQDPHLF